MNTYENCTNKHDHDMDNLILVIKKLCFLFRFHETILVQSQSESKYIVISDFGLFPDWSDHLPVVVQTWISKLCRMCSEIPVGRFPAISEFAMMS